MRPEKTSITKEITDKLQSSSFVLFIGYKGLSVEQFYDLRGRLRKKGSRVQVVKNSMLTHAVHELKWDGLPSSVAGPTAIVYGSGDVTETAKVMAEFMDGNNHVPVGMGGRLGTQLLSVSDVESLAKLPSREVMLGRLVGTVAAPLTRVVGVLNQKLLSLLYVLKAVEDKKNKPN